MLNEIYLLKKVKSPKASTTVNTFVSSHSTETYNATEDYI